MFGLLSVPDKIIIFMLITLIVIISYIFIVYFKANTENITNRHFWYGFVMITIIVILCVIVIWISAYFRTITPKNIITYVPQTYMKTNKFKQKRNIEKMKRNGLGKKYVDSSSSESEDGEEVVETQEIIKEEEMKTI